ncbi:MAG: signal recognition particle protein [Planctomycetia bacterium]|nr:signal recognition particle protein [Planctomycetia bacterium]
MFDSLRDGLSSALRTLQGRGKLTESNMREGLQMVQQALLEADVSYLAVKDFMAKISEEALGEAVMKKLDPTQQLVKMVHDRLVEMMGPVDHSLHLKGSGVTTLMMCGLQGSGKTTTTGKLGRMIKIRGRKPMLVAADLQRPAAIEQLKVLGEQLEIPVYTEPGQTDPVKVCTNAVAYAGRMGCDVLILDTAGRLHIDEELMQQLVRIENLCRPDQVYLVVDAMTGQDAVNSAKAFNEALELDGVIMTKLDGDSRGGAAISLKHITGVPIKFMGTGEQLTALEEFHPDRMAGRILGMGDMMSLIERAQQEFDQDEMKRQEERLRKGEFTLDDFQRMMAQTKRLGSIGKIMSFIPGMDRLAGMMGDVDADKEMNKIGGIINSMTPAEKRNPKMIDLSRRRRIAAGSGVQPNQVNDLIKQFIGMADIMRQMSGMGAMGRMGAMQEIMRKMQADPTAQIAAKKGDTGKRLTASDKAKMRKLREKARKKKRK